MSLIQQNFNAISESVVIIQERIKKTFNIVSQMDTFKIEKNGTTLGKEGGGLKKLGVKITILRREYNVISI